MYALIPGYFFGSNEIVKLMKIDGSWEYNEEMLNNLNLGDKFKVEVAQHQGNKKKGMTAVMVAYLETTYPQEKD